MRPALSLLLRVSSPRLVLQARQGAHPWPIRIGARRMFLHPRHCGQAPAVDPTSVLPFPRKTRQRIDRAVMLDSRAQFLRRTPAASGIAVQRGGPRNAHPQLFSKGSGARKVPYTCKTNKSGGINSKDTFGPATFRTGEQAHASSWLGGRRCRQMWPRRIGCLLQAPGRHSSSLGARGWRLMQPLEPSTVYIVLARECWCAIRMQGKAMKDHITQHDMVRPRRPRSGWNDHGGRRRLRI